MNQADPIFGTNISPEEREKLLESHCVHKERTTFTQDLSSEEYFSLQSGYVRGSIDLQRMEDEAKAASDEWKKKIKEKEDTLKKSLEEITQGRKKVVGILYSIRDLAKGLMLRYNKLGELIEQRPLKEDEKQPRLFIEGAGGGTVPNPDAPRPTEDVDHVEVKEGSADEQIAGMYAGPTIAGSAPGNEDVPDAEYENDSKGSSALQGDSAPVTFGGGNLEESGIYDDVSRSGNGLNPDPEGFKAQSKEENGMAWDDPRQTRADVSGAAKATEEGAVAAKKGKPGRKKKVPQTSENPNGEANQE